MIIRANSTIVMISLVLLTTTNIGHADFFGPDTYDECITDSMKGVTSDLAAKAIIASCRKQFSAEKLAGGSRALSGPEKALLTGTGGQSYGYFKVNIYNGNPNVTITELTIGLRPKGVEGAQFRLYRETVSYPGPLGPLKRREILIDYESVDGAKGYDWYIESAKGYQSPE